MPLKTNGIGAGKAPLTEAAGGVRNHLMQILPAEEGQTVCPDEGLDLLHGIAAGDQLLSVRNIRPEMAGRQEGRGGNPHMHLCRSGLPQQGDDLAGGRSTDDGVVDHDHPFALHAASQGAQLDAHGLLPALLSGRDEGAPHIAVFNQPDPIGNTGLLRIAHGGVQPGVRNADDHIRLRRAGPGQQAPRLPPGHVDRLAAEDGANEKGHPLFSRCQL